MARYLATRVLARLEVLSPKDWAEVIAQELSVVATSPYAAEDNAAVAERAQHDDPAARALLMMRGALYAARESAIIEGRSKGAKRLQGVLSALLKAAATDEGSKALPMSAWLDALGKEDPDAAKSLDAILTKGGPITLPPSALGPCYRAGVGEYVAFDAGFDKAG